MVLCSRSVGRTPPLVGAALALLLAAGPAESADRDVAATVTSAAADVSDPSATRIDELIRQLGSPEFTVRRAAASEIRRIGPEAFDQLHAATDDSDPEIAASARYLLRQIAVRWTRSDDSATVRGLLQRYGDREDTERQKIIQALAALPQHEGAAGLCRVARFDRTPLLARLAALSIIQSVNRDDDESAPRFDPVVFDRELGESTRVPVLWLRQYQLQLRDPAASVAGWQELTEEESKRLDSDITETTPALVSALWWNLADVHFRLGEPKPLVDVGERLLAVNGNNSDELIGSFLNWLVEHEAWDALELFAENHDDRVQKLKEPLYLVAFASARQGQGDAAETLAERAAKLPTTKPLDSANAAHLMASLGQFNWAVREYQSGIDSQPIEATSAMGSRVLLSNLLQDYEQYDAAAEVLTPLVEAIEKNRDVRRTYQTAQADFAQEGHYLPEPNMVAARHDYLWACHFEQERDVAKQREHLSAAIKHDETDADVLIAMYRLEGADDAWLADVRRRIEKLSESIEEEIEDRPDNSIAYNQWAWLIANTEGNYQKAVRYSRRSLELEPGTASFLDTLGRCYYAVGDLENAVKHQREAVRLIPHMQVMQRQLRMFEKALADAENRKKAG